MYTTTTYIKHYMKWMTERGKELSLQVMPSIELPDKIDAHMEYAFQNIYRINLQLLHLICVIIPKLHSSPCDYLPVY